MDYLEIHNEVGDLIPRMGQTTHKHKPCRDCGQDMEYDSETKKICFDCKLKKRKEWCDKKKEGKI